MCAYVLYLISHITEENIFQIEDSTPVCNLQILWISYLSWHCEWRQSFTWLKWCVNYALNAPWKDTRKITPKAIKLKQLRPLFQGLVLCQGPGDHCTQHCLSSTWFNTLLFLAWLMTTLPSKAPLCPLSELFPVVDSQPLLAETDSLETSLKLFRFLKVGTEMAISVHLSSRVEHRYR